jgi:hypothetical protein
MDKLKYFTENKYVVLENLISPDITSFLYNYFILKGCTNRDFDDQSESLGDDWVKGTYGDLTAETTMSQLEPIMSQVTQKKLCPSYSYSRIYIKGDQLKIHSDRPSCQYSVTLNLGGDPWPIYFGVFDENSKDGVTYNFKKVKILNEVLLKPGDGAVYMGEELLHWRDPFAGDHCVQTFLHYVDSEDENYKSHWYDGRYNIGFLR